MAETAPAIKPKWQFLLGLLPSINSCIVAIVSAALTYGGTVLHERYKAPEAKPVISALLGTDEVLHRLSLIEGHAALCVDGIMALRNEFKAPPKAGLPAAKTAKK